MNLLKNKYSSHEVLGVLFCLAISALVSIIYDGYLSFSGKVTTLYLPTQVFVLMILLFSVSIIVGPLIGKIVYNNFNK